MGSIPPAVSMKFITTISGAWSLLHQGYRYTLNCRTADEKRLATIKEKYEAGDYTLSEVLKAHSHWVSF